MARSDGSQSGGGLLGGIIGAVAGFFLLGGIGGAVKGFMYGSTIGGILAPPSGPDIVGPRLEDLSVQTSSNVADLPRFDGTMGLYGNMIWAKENKLQEVVTTTTKKKKLLGFTVSKVKTTTYTYYLNCAIAFALMDEEDDCQLLKVWIGDKLVLNRTTDDVGTILAGLDFDEYFTFYPGKDDPLLQPVDPEIAEDVGILNASAYPGVCYMVIRDLDLTPWGDSAARAQVKVELTSGEAAATDLQFISQTPVPLHPQYVINWNANFIDQEGLHVWKWGSELEEDALVPDTDYAPYNPTDFDKLHYIAIPDGGGYLKDKITDLIPAMALIRPQDEMKSTRHVAKGKADQNAALFVTTFMRTFSDGDGTGYPSDPRLHTPGTWRYSNFGGGFPVYFNTFFEGFNYAFNVEGWDFYLDEGERFNPEYMYPTLTPEGAFAGYFWRIYPEGHPLDYPRFGVWWTDGVNPPPYFPLTGDSFFGPGIEAQVMASLTLVMPDFNKEYTFNISSVPVGNSHYCLSGEDLFWAYDDGEGVQVYKIRADGAILDTTGISDVSNPVALVRIGMVDGELCVVTRIGTTAQMRIINPDDFTDFTDYDSAAINTAFGHTGANFYNNVSMDFTKFVYYRSPNVYTKTSFAASQVLIGNASANLITGADEPSFFNMWLRGNLLAVSTFGGSLPETGVQFFSVGTLSPGMAQLADILRKYCLLAGIADARINTSLINQEVRGHRVAKRGSVRNVIEQLRGCWPFDIVPSGYELKFVPRGTSPVATISYEDLGPDVQWVQDREMTPQIPWRLSLRYLDRDLEYEINEQQSQRPLDSDTEHTLEIPVVFTPDEAAQRINILHSIFLTERKSYSGFQLPPPYRYLEPADVINVVFPDATYQVRLANLKVAPSGLITGDGKPNAVEIYTSTATGSTRVPPVQTIPVAGGEVTVLLDIPLIEAYEDDPGFTAVMASVYGNWTGGILYRTTDNGTTWTEVSAFDGACTFGVCQNALTEHGGHVIDYGSELTVKIYAGGTPVSVTEDQMLDEVTIAAYGQHGRWEIIAFQNCTVSGEFVVFDTLIRGMRGTEWATGLHAPNDYFVLLTDDDNAFITVQESDIGNVLTYRGASIGADFGSRFNTTLEYNAVNLTPLSPIDAFGVRDGSNNLTGYFTRRSRMDADMTLLESIYSGGVPLGEATEAYEIDIMDGDTVVRTIPATSETFPYSAANQTTDFGSTQAAVDVKIYQISAVVGRGYALEATI